VEAISWNGRSIRWLSRHVLDANIHNHAGASCLVYCINCCILYVRCNRVSRVTIKQSPRGAVHTVVTYVSFYDIQPLLFRHHYTVVMLVLQDLPVELALKCFSYLPVQHLSALLKTSSYWKTFFDANESIIYRNAAVLHGFVPSCSPDTSLSHANSLYSDRVMVGVDNWKTFCM
jgi:hypothetical protein